MPKICVLLSLGSSNPLLVLLRSSKALVLGVVVPMPMLWALVEMRVNRKTRVGRSFFMFSFFAGER